MSLHSCLLCDRVPLTTADALLVLNSAGDPFVPSAFQQVRTGTITLAEDNIAVLQAVYRTLGLNLTALREERQQALSRIQHVAFHDYILHQPISTHDVAVMNLLYQPANAWIAYGLHLAFIALKPGGRLYITGAKDRGILTVAKHMRELFGSVETLAISKGQRVVCAYKSTQTPGNESIGSISNADMDLSTHIFAASKLDEGTRLLLDALDVRATDTTLDIGCGAGFIGLHIARLAHKGQVIMVDASLAAVAASQHAIELSNLDNIRVLPSDGVQAVSAERFDLVVTNPPFHQGGIQTTSIAERFIRDAASVLQPGGRFYLVANRFLKYETTLHACFKNVQEVGGNSRYKVLLASDPVSPRNK
jgi:16S rRNA (guanine1207-N2)-methyltransferase